MRFTRVILCADNLTILISALSSTAWTHRVSFMHSPVDGHLGKFQFSVIMDTAFTSILVLYTFNKYSSFCLCFGVSGEWTQGFCTEIYSQSFFVVLFQDKFLLSHEVSQAVVELVIFLPHNAWDCRHVPPPLALFLLSKYPGVKLLGDEIHECLV